jgi:hypothetical protein
MLPNSAAIAHARHRAPMVQEAVGSLRSVARSIHKYGHRDRSPHTPSEYLGNQPGPTSFEVGSRTLVGFHCNRARHLGHIVLSGSMIGRFGILDDLVVIQPKRINERPQQTHIHIKAHMHTKYNNDGMESVMSACVNVNTRCQVSCRCQCGTVGCNGRTYIFAIRVPLIEGLALHTVQLRRACRTLTTTWI